MNPPPMMMCGGFSGAKEPTDDIHQLVSDVKNSVQNKTGKTYTTFTAVNYKSQVVAGTNYTVKVQVGDNDYIHIKVFKPLPCYGTELEIHSVDENKGENDDL